MKNLMELGRSMVEMLGVLAIIGVLSIVGIQGYKRAMLKNKANELMHLMQIVYNDARMKALVDPSATESYLLASSYDPSKTNNMGMEKPSWATFRAFNVRVLLTSSTYDNIYLYATGSCDICFELEKSLERKSSSEKFLYLPGGKGTADDKNVHVYCYGGKSTDTVGTSFPCYDPSATHY